MYIIESSRLLSVCVCVYLNKIFKSQSDFNAVFHNRFKYAVKTSFTVYIYIYIYIYRKRRNYRPVEIPSLILDLSLKSRKLVYTCL